MSLGLFLFVTGYVLIWGAVKDESPLVILKDVLSGRLDSAGGNFASSGTVPDTGSTPETFGTGTVSIAAGVVRGPHGWMLDSIKAAAKRAGGTYVISNWKAPRDYSSCHPSGRAIDVKGTQLTKFAVEMTKENVSPGSGIHLDSDGQGVHYHAEWEPCE